ncbi:MAG: hypothetical protein PWP12_614 [Bacillota bacterium]|nr:hypothetical protein [Bacillota bacterium]MDK2881746.1 hypothetical protein [Bacillota bacterium]MDK2960430.1 hypothetical protein [Bacillota bacterium]
MAEWLKALASKASRRFTCLVSSNLTLSAITIQYFLCRPNYAERWLSLVEGARLESE